MPNELPSRDNLAVCGEHGIMTFAREERRRCPLCALDGEYDVRPGADLPGNRLGSEDVTQNEVRQRLEAEDLEELLPLMDEYLEDVDQGPMHVTVARFDGTMPAGYSEGQERWINVVVYRFSGMEKAITSSGDAQETIENLRSEGYGDD